MYFYDFLIKGGQRPPRYDIFVWLKDSDRGCTENYLTIFYFCWTGDGSEETIDLRPNQYVCCRCSDWLWDNSLIGIIRPHQISYLMLFGRRIWTIISIQDSWRTGYNIDLFSLLNILDWNFPPGRQRGIIDLKPNRFCFFCGDLIMNEVPCGAHQVTISINFEIYFWLNDLDRDFKDEYLTVFFL